MFDKTSTIYYNRRPANRNDPTINTAWPIEFFYFCL